MNLAYLLLKAYNNYDVNIVDMLFRKQPKGAELLCHSKEKLRHSVRR